LAVSLNVRGRLDGLGWRGELMKAKVDIVVGSLVFLGNQEELDVFNVGDYASRVIRSLADVSIEELLELDRLRCHCC
jgi:hypothetical protein